MCPVLHKLYFWQLLYKGKVLLFLSKLKNSGSAARPRQHLGTNLGPSQAGAVRNGDSVGEAVPSGRTGLGVARGGGKRRGSAPDLPVSWIR